MRELDSVQEEEAAWLGSCLQIPRVGLLWALKRGMDEEMIISHFGASGPIVRYRRGVSGIDKQLARMRKR